MSQVFFCYGTTLAGLANVQTKTVIPPHVLGESLRTPVLGGVRRRSLAGRLRADGWINSVLAFDFLAQADLDAFVYATLGGYTTPSVQMYFSLLDITGHYTPYLGYMATPSFSVSGGGYPRNVVFELTNLSVQSSTKTSNYTITTSDKLTYGNTASGSITFTLPALAGVTANVPYSFVKTSASNSLVIDGDGAELVNGAATQTLTENNARLDIVKNDSGLWVTI